VSQITFVASIFAASGARYANQTEVAKETDVVFGPIAALILASVGFVAGYSVRASISRKRRALAREEWLIRLAQKRYDES
jgi:hypothetical protein